MQNKKYLRLVYLVFYFFECFFIQKIVLISDEAFYDIKRVIFFNGFTSLIWIFFLKEINTKNFFLSFLGLFFSSYITIIIYMEIFIWCNNEAGLFEKILYPFINALPGLLILYILSIISMSGLILFFKWIKKIEKRIPEKDMDIRQ